MRPPLTVAQARRGKNQSKKPRQPKQQPSQKGFGRREDPPSRLPSRELRGLEFAQQMLLLSRFKGDPHEQLKQLVLDSPVPWQPPFWWSGNSPLCPLERAEATVARLQGSLLAAGSLTYVQQQVQRLLGCEHPGYAQALGCSPAAAAAHALAEDWYMVADEESWAVPIALGALAPVSCACGRAGCGRPAAVLDPAPPFLFPQAHLAFLAHAARQPGLSDEQVDAILACLLEHDNAFTLNLRVSARWCAVVLVVGGPC